MNIKNQDRISETLEKLREEQQQNKKGLKSTQTIC